MTADLDPVTRRLVLVCVAISAGILGLVLALAAAGCGTYSGRGAPCPRLSGTGSPPGAGSSCEVRR